MFFSCVSRAIGARWPLRESKDKSAAASPQTVTDRSAAAPLAGQEAAPRPPRPAPAPPPVGQRILISPPARVAPKTFLALPVEVQKLVVQHLSARDIARLEEATYGAGKAPVFWQHFVEPLQGLLGAHHAVAAHTVRSLLFVGLSPQALEQLDEGVRRALVQYLRPFAEDVALTEQLCNRPYLCREVRDAAYAAYNLTLTPLGHKKPRRTLDVLGDGLVFAARAFARRSQAEEANLDAALALLTRELVGEIRRLAAHHADSSRGRGTCLLSLSARCQKIVHAAEAIGELAGDADAADERVQ